MENLEEVLQALDEFQKMRPTEIPRELEDYLCWVAKTGDPIYQWPMIKTLFREKLTRVMTDFYESCPSLELAPCPNVEHFNYDTMKTTLLERLESFANAPFTVQRICELLTAPRKEYNRVDKFMRAIEKNILVVSTREPGPIARRGETGDGMVNGSVEEDTASVTQQQQQPPPPSPPPSPSPSSSPSQPTQPQVTQSAQPTSQDVEMDWEKDCASTVTISVHTVENETPLLHTVVPGGAGALSKNALFSTPVGREKLEQVPSRADQLGTSNFIAATSDFSAISNLTAQVEQSHETIASGSAIPVVQSLPTSVAMVPDDSPVVVTSDDVAEAIMSDDPATQSGTLDMENEEAQTTTAAITTTTTTTITATVATVAGTATTTMTTTTTTTTMTTTATTATTATMMTTTAATTTTTTTAITSSTSAAAATTTVTVVATVIPLTTDTTRKLQAAFQAKRFEPGDNKCPDKPDEKIPVTLGDSEEVDVYSAKSEEVSSSKLDAECIDSNEISHKEDRLMEDPSKMNIDMRSDVLADDASKVYEERISRNKSEREEASTLEGMVEETLCSKSCIDSVKTTVFIESSGGNENGAIMPDDCVSAVIVSNGEALHRNERLEAHCKETSATILSKETSMQKQSANRKIDNVETMDAVLESVPRIASSEDDDNARQVQNADFGADGTKMMNISEDSTNLGESMVSDSTRIMEHTGESAAIKKLDSTLPVDETADVSNDSLPNIICRSARDNEKLMRVEDEDGVNANVQSDRVTTCIAAVAGKQSVIESTICRREHEPMEMMEMDDEETTSTYQQDEQMDTMEELPRS